MCVASSPLAVCCDGFSLDPSPEFLLGPLLSAPVVGQFLMYYVFSNLSLESLSSFIYSWISHLVCIWIAQFSVMIIGSDTCWGSHSLILSLLRKMGTICSVDRCVPYYAESGPWLRCLINRSQFYLSQKCYLRQDQPVYVMFVSVQSV